MSVAREAQQRLYERALIEHERIFPCSRTGKFSDCYTLVENKVFFWFNTEDQTTHLVAEELP